jgi:hypothetical protein
MMLMKIPEQSPIILFILLILTIFFVETGIMLSLNYIAPIFPTISTSFLDSLILILVLFPILYFRVYRYILSQVNERKKIEEELEKWQRLAVSRERMMVEPNE